MQSSISWFVVMDTPAARLPNRHLEERKMTREPKVSMGRGLRAPRLLWKLAGSALLLLFLLLRLILLLIPLPVVRRVTTSSKPVGGFLGVKLSCQSNQSNLRALRMED